MNLLFPSSSPSARRPGRFPQVQSMVAAGPITNNTKALFSFLKGKQGLLYYFFKTILSYIL
jgi:hypothetical protein